MPTPTWKGPTDQFVEASNSPSFQATISGTVKTRTFHCLYSYGAVHWTDFYPGTIGSGSDAGYISGAVNYVKLRGNIGQLQVQWNANASGSGATLPPDEVGVNPDNLNPRLENHPRFASLDAAALANIETALRAQDDTKRSDAYTALSSLGQELVDRIRRGNESYYLAALRYSWVTHSWTIPSSTRGGYVETPVGPLSAYFVGDISWLRESDSLQYQNGIWRRTRTWLGGPDGNFDPDLDT